MTILDGVLKDFQEPIAMIGVLEKVHVVQLFMHLLLGANPCGGCVCVCVCVRFDRAI